MSANSGLKAIAESTGDLYNISLDNLHEIEGFNVRDDYGDIDAMAKSFADGSDIPPLKVRLDKDAETPSAGIVDGHRRYRAAKIAIEKYGADIKSLSCYNEKRGSNEESRIVDLFTCNAGKALTATEQARVVTRLINFNWKPADISRKIGKSQNYVSGLLNLEEASAELKKAIKDQIISTTAAIKLASSPVKDQIKVLDKLTTAITPNKKVKVKDIEKATKGTPAMISSKKIKDIEKQVEVLVNEDRKDHKTWVAVLYGIQLALGSAEFSDNFKA